MPTPTRELAVEYAEAIRFIYAEGIRFNLIKDEAGIDHQRLVNEQFNRDSLLKHIQVCYVALSQENPPEWQAAAAIVRRIEALDAQTREQIAGETLALLAT